MSEASTTESRRWCELVATVGADIALPLSSALERVQNLTSSGRIDKEDLRALKEEITRAREAGINAQQLSRFASGRLRQSHERLSLNEMLESVLIHRAREIQARGMVLTPHLSAVEVIVDGPLLFSLVNSAIDWALRHARSEIRFDVDTKSWPAHARLVCRFCHRPEDQPADAASRAPSSVPPSADPGLDSLTWRLLEQTALTMGLHMERQDEINETRLTLEFPQTVASVVKGMSSAELNEGFALSTNSKPLAGSHVLVVGARREVRSQVREAIKNMGLIVDHVSSVAEATDFCRDGLPHAIIFEGALRSEKLTALFDEISAEAPQFAFVEIIEEGRSFEMSGFGGSHLASVGRDGIADALPSVLMFELSKGL